MPKIGMEILVAGTSNFKFSAVGTGRLGATEYTLVTIAVDLSGSVKDFKQELETAVRKIYEASKKSPRANNLLVRLVGFSSVFPNHGVEELHGYKPLSEIDPAQVKLPLPSSGTPLFDVALNAVEAANAYGKKLDEEEYTANSLIVLITDGADTCSFFTPARVAEALKVGVKEEYLESNLSILIGINPDTYADMSQTVTNGELLAKFKDDAKLDYYIKVADATPGNLAKMAAFVSHSVSSQSQALGTGGPSQAIAPTI